MNTQSSTVAEAIEPQSVAVAEMPTRPLYWSIRREIWENRSIYIAPIAVGAVSLIGFLIRLPRLPQIVRAASSLDAVHYREAIATHYDFIAGAMMATAILVSAFYCAESLYGERRDRSILFWKSLPVSDLTAVLAKASVPLLIVPVIATLAAAALQWIMLLLSSAVLAGSGLSVARYWTELSVFQMWGLLFYHIMTAHALWPAPIYGWLMFVSAWAKRAVLLWAALPLVAIGALEALLFRTSHFAMLLARRFIGDSPSAIMQSHDMFPTNPLTHITPGAFLTSPGLWIGLLIMAAFLAGAVQLRRNRGSI